VARTIAAILHEAREACGNPEVKCLVVAAAGAGRPAARASLETAISHAGIRARVRAIGDGEAALESAFPGAPGIVVLSGTGSIAYARDRAGVVHRAGGLGWQLGDEGGGYAIGRAALAAVGRAADGRGPATGLGDPILQATGSVDIDALIQWAQTAKREDVAALAQLVGEAANKGDAIAKKLLERAADDLATLVETLLRRMAPDLPDGIALAGGLLGMGSPLRLQLTSALHGVAPGSQLLNRTIDPALGAASLATRL
jgi:N-acetylglucosamine kinase-like BadF-type ATPase